MKKYNVGIIGYGWVATAHIQAINASSNAQVTAIYSSRPQNAAELSERWGTPIKSGYIAVIEHRLALHIAPSQQRKALYNS